MAAALALSLVTSVASVGAEGLSLSLTESAALLVLTAWGVREKPAPHGAVIVGAGALGAALVAVLLRLDAGASSTCE